jgi:hypothetical protein
VIKEFQERSLCRVLLFKALLVVRLRQIRIAPRIPSVDVDAVENAMQIGRPGTQNAVETEAVFLRLNLAGVGGADRGDAL